MKRMPSKSLASRHIGKYPILRGKEKHITEGIVLGGGGRQFNVIHKLCI